MQSCTLQWCDIVLILVLLSATVLKDSETWVIEGSGTEEEEEDIWGSGGYTGQEDKQRSSWARCAYCNFNGYCVDDHNGFYNCVCNDCYLGRTCGVRVRACRTSTLGFPEYFDENECDECEQDCIHTESGIECTCWDGYIMVENRCNLSPSQIGRNVNSLIFSVKDLDHIWQAGLTDRTSHPFQTVVRDVESNVSSMFREMSGFREMKIVLLREGSVIVDAVLIISNSEDLEDYYSRINMYVRQQGKLWNLNVDPSYLIVEEGVGYITSVIVHGQHNILNGTKTEVLCEIDAVTLPGLMTVGWKLSGVDVIPLPNSRLQISELVTSPTDPTKFTSKLVFDPVVMDDAGIIQCDVKVGRIERNNSYTMLVHNIDITPKYVSVKLGLPVNIKCSLPVTNFNNLTMSRIRWCKNDVPITSVSDAEIITSVDERVEIMTITSVKKTTEYGCGLDQSNGQGSALCHNKMTLFVYDPADKPCPEQVDDKGTQWKETFPGEVVYNNCTIGYTGVVSRECISGGNQSEWADPDYSECVDQRLSVISKQVEQIYSGLAVLPPQTLIRHLFGITVTYSAGYKLTVGDLGSCVDILFGIADLLGKNIVHVNDTEAEEFLSIVDFMLNAEMNDTWFSLQTMNDNTPVAASVMKAVSTFGIPVVKSLPTGIIKTVEKGNIVAEFKRSEVEDIIFPHTYVKDVDGIIIMREDTMRNNKLSVDGTVDYIGTYFKTLSEFIPDTAVENYISGETETVSGILALTLTTGAIDNLNPPVELHFFRNEYPNGTRSCVSWDFSLPNDGGWSSKGCEVVFTNDTITECKCDHLTNFAVLMSPYVEITAVHHKVLSMMSLIGCIISLVSMALTVFCHISFWRHLKSDKSMILVNICLALMMALVIFLTGVERTENKTLCTVIAVLLHYFFLASFFLMLAEGISLVRSAVISVFSVTSKLQYFLPLGWGMPVVIVAISTGVTKLQGYGNENFCWLSVNDGVIYSFIAPALMVVSINWVIAILVFRSLFSTQAVMNKTGRDKLKTGVRSVVVLAPLLGLTWVFGVLSVNEDTVIFQYLFVIFNSLQGLVIFLCHCVLNKEIYNAIRRKCVCFGPVVDDSSSSSSSSRKQTNTQSV